MVRKLLREFFLLPRGEQRALILLGLLVIITLGFRISLANLPQRRPPGLEQFREEAFRVRAMLERLDRTDSLNQTSGGFHLYASSLDSARYRSHSRSPSSPGVARGGQLRVHLNTADSTALLRLPGIGPVFAGRIIKYRRLLGGFYCSDQLKEVYGMKEETIEQITPLLVLDSIGLVKLNVNTCTFRDLLRHPYLEYEDVKALVGYMDLEGEINSMGEIRENFLFSEAALERIEPYLDFSH